MTKSKRGPGRPLKPLAEKPKQFSIRLRPKLKIGLELLAADMQQSISQTAELALMDFFLKFPLSNGKTVDQTLRDFPPAPTEAERVLLTYRHLPSALPIGDRLLGQMVWSSDEMKEALKKNDDEEAVWELISWCNIYWPVLQNIAHQRGMDVAGLEIKKLVADEVSTNKFYVQAHPEALRKAGIAKIKPMS